MTRKVTRRNLRRRSTRVARRSTRRSTRRSARRSTRRVARRSTRALKRSIRKNVRHSTRRSTRRKNVKRSSRRSTRRSTRRRNMRKEIMVGGMKEEVDMTEKHCKKFPHYEVTPEMRDAIEKFLQEMGVTRDEPMEVTRDEPMEGGSNDGEEDEEESFDIIPRVPLSVTEQQKRYQKMLKAGYIAWNKGTDSQVVKRAQRIFAEGSKIIIACVFYLKPELLGCVSKWAVASAFKNIKTIIQGIIYILLGIVSGALSSWAGISMALFSGINAILKKVGEIPPNRQQQLQAARRMNDTLVSALYSQVVETFWSFARSAEDINQVFDKFGILLTSKYINNFYVFPAEETNEEGVVGIVNMPLRAEVIVNIDELNQAKIQKAQWKAPQPAPPLPEEHVIELFDKYLWIPRKAGPQPKYNNVYLINFGTFSLSITGIDPHIKRSYILSGLRIGDQFLEAARAAAVRKRTGRDEEAEAEAEAEAGDEDENQQPAEKRRHVGNIPFKTPFSQLLAPNNKDGVEGEGEDDMEVTDEDL